MNLLFRIIYAAHASGTHHRLALDALRHLSCDDVVQWQKLFLNHASKYLEGSKAPDKSFKDFKNHVLHVRDNYWGGAPEKASEWYVKLVGSLRGQEWEQVAYNAGVLSHYYTDPIQPFHTAQSEAENTIHRAAEWSISKSYIDLRKQGERNFADLDVDITDGDYWVMDMVRRGAELSNQYYEALIAHYNFDLGVVDPPAGLNKQSRALLARLIVYAAKGFAHILDRAIEESGARAPDVNLTARTVLASLQIPIRWVTNKIEDVQDRRLVQKIYDELQETGTVETNLPEDDRQIRDLYQAEDRNQPVQRLRSEDIDDAAQDDQLSSDADAFSDDLEEYGLQRDYGLAPSSAVEKAPSIGRKTAERLARAKIYTVSDLIEADPESVANKLQIQYITKEAVSDWQDKARLACLIPGLLGSHAQLLVGCDYRHLGEIAEVDPHDLLGDIIQFSETKAGRRLVRSGYMPEMDDIQEWIHLAKEALTSKAA